MGTFECGACGHATSGYARRELVEQGWTFHPVKGAVDFPLCDCCTAEYQRRRSDKAKAAA